jgi:hypothetical protein
MFEINAEMKGLQLYYRSNFEETKGKEIKEVENSSGRDSKPTK